MASLAETYDVALVDLDGVVYVGSGPVDHAAEALAKARADGMRLAFVTNNAARPPQAVAEHLSRLGIAVSSDEVVTSAQAAARVLADMLPTGAGVLVVGGEGLVAALQERGLRPVRDLAGDPLAVIQGFHPDVDWRMLAEGSYAVAAGLPWVASNTDRTLPTPRGTAPGNGTLVDAIRTATGRAPTVAGKPEPPMHQEAILRSGARRPLVVGDRLDTDIEGARRAGVDSLLVLTGVTDPVGLVRAPAAQHPTYVAPDLRALGESADAVTVQAGLARCGGASAAIEGGRVVVRHSPGHDSSAKLDVLRAVCGAAWAAGDPVTVPGVETVLAEAGWIVHPSTGAPY
jgi:HAD superfamily hydrolase (TIGR01450 family)